MPIISITWSQIIKMRTQYSIQLRIQKKMFPGLVQLGIEPPRSESHILVQHPQRALKKIKLVTESE